MIYSHLHLLCKIWFIIFIMLEMSTPLHPPAKLCYVLIVLGWLTQGARVNHLLAPLCEIKTHSVDLTVDPPVR